MNVQQTVSASIVRKFTNNESAPITVDLRADLTGTINFNSINYNYAYHFDQNPETDPILDETHYAYYLLSGQVTITEYDPLAVISNTYIIPIDNNNQGGTIEDIVIHPATEGYYYELVCPLYLETHIKNYQSGATGFQSYALDGPFFVGTDSGTFPGVRLSVSVDSQGDAKSLGWLPLLLLD